MNISLTSTLSAFKPPADNGPARPGTAAKGAGAALLETGLQAQLINKDTTIPQAVKDEKLKATSAGPGQGRPGGRSGLTPRNVSAS